MGFGLPAALGAQVARPGATVVCVSGDGSLLMNVQELATAVEEELPVKVVLLDNASLGMVRQQQDLFWGGRRAASGLGGALNWELVARGSASRRPSTSPRNSRTRWPRRWPSRARPCCASASRARPIACRCRPRRSRQGDDRMTYSPCTVAISVPPPPRLRCSHR